MTLSCLHNRRFGLAILALSMMPASLHAASSFNWAHYARLAHQRNLSEDTGWLRLGHYATQLGQPRESQVDDPRFFLADSGKTDPAAELNATLEALAQPVTAVADNHAACRFPARAAYLHAQVWIPLESLPAPEQCPKLRHYLQSNVMHSVSVIFSSYYISNPPSAFGHTFLRLERPGLPNGTKRSDLLHLGLDYAAATGNESPVIFALKGFAGSFPGRYTFLPYYYKVREYADYESRDLWEYHLNLRPEAIERFVLHMWELGNTWYWYWFFTENCSYHILAAIEAADPQIELLRHIKTMVVPADTIKALYAVPGLVRGVTYRPSLRSQFEARLSQVPREAYDLVEELVTDTALPLPTQYTAGQRATILDAAADLHDFRAQERVMNKATDSTEAQVKYDLLLRRAQLGVTSPPYEIPIPHLTAPHLTHGWPRMGFRAGYHNLLAGYTAVELRVGLHDLADPAPGYPDQFDVSFLDTEFRYYALMDRFRLHHLTIAELNTLNSASRFFGGASYTVGLSLNYLDDSRCIDCTVAQTYAGGGVAYSAPSGWLTAYATLGGQIMAHAELRGIAESPARVSLMALGGLRLRLIPTLVAVLRAQPLYAPLQHAPFAFDGNATLRWGFTRHAALDMLYRATHTGHDGSLAVYYYF